MKKHVLAAPGLDKPEAPVRKSLDGAFCHLFHFLRDRPEALPENTVLGILHREARIVPCRGMTSTVGRRPQPRGYLPEGRARSADSDSQMMAKAADIGVRGGRRWNLGRRQVLGNVRVWAQWTSVDGRRRGLKIKVSALRFCPGPPDSHFLSRAYAARP